MNERNPIDTCPRGAARLRMPSVDRLRAGICALGCAAGLLAAAGRPASAAKPVVSLAIMADGKGVYHASLLYPRVVDKASRLAEANELWQRSGWTPISTDWSTIPAFRRFPARSSLDFTVGTLYPKGEVPVEALVLAYRRWGGVDVTIVKEGPVQYGGLPHYVNADATMDVSASSNVLNVGVRVKNPELRSLHFTSLTPPGPAQSTTAAGRRRRAPAWVVILFGLVAAGATWILVYALALGKKPVEATAATDSPPHGESRA